MRIRKHFIRCSCVLLAYMVCGCGATSVPAVQETTESVQNVEATLETSLEKDAEKGIENTEEEVVYFDMLGTVVEKLPEDQYYNHYKVKGADDVIYICNYNGEDELNPEDIVWMYQIQDGGWTIEVPDAKGGNEMSDNKNMELSDEKMANVTGGVVDVDPYGYLCDGTVGTGTAHGKTNGVETTDYSVDGDNGKGYWAVYMGKDELKPGTRVRIIHMESGWNAGGYEIELID